MQPAINRYWPIFAGVDGTGDANNDVYANVFRNSHVQELSRLPWRSKPFYQRGPTLSGRQTKQIAEEAASSVELMWKNAIARNEFPRVFLAGYSRGGAAMIHAAGTLKRMGINVACLALFDAVELTWTVEAESITSNVQMCRHAIRKKATLSRKEFGNCGLRCDDGSMTKFDLPPREFFCTHGAMGGTPWQRTDPQTRLNDDGYIVEPRSVRKGLAYTSATAAVAALSLIGVPAAPAIPKIIDVATDFAATRVTPEEDLAGSLAVRAWMNTWFMSCFLYQPN